MSVLRSCILTEAQLASQCQHRQHNSSNSNNCKQRQPGMVHPLSPSKCPHARTHLSDLSAPIALPRSSCPAPLFCRPAPSSSSLDDPIPCQTPRVPGRTLSRRRHRHVEQPVPSLTGPVREVDVHTLILRCLRPHHLCIVLLKCFLLATNCFNLRSTRACKSSPIPNSFISALTRL